MKVVAALISLLCAVAFVSGQSRNICTTNSGTTGQCRPLVKCVKFVHEIPLLRNQPCRLVTGEKGVCCPHIVPGTATCELRKRVLLARTFET